MSVELFVLSFIIVASSAIGVSGVVGAKVVVVGGANVVVVDDDVVVVVVGAIASVAALYIAVVLYFDVEVFVVFTLL